jgi:hypothetical protein
MKIALKSLPFVCLFAVFQLVSCSGPENKPPERIETQELPAKTDSLAQQPKDGTAVEK